MELNRKNKDLGYKIAVLIVIVSQAFVYSGCKVSYSASGASIAPSIKTFSIQYFQNRAPLVQPQLSQNLTDALIDKCKSETNLAFVNGLGDVNFEGEISDYVTRPLTVGPDAQAAMNRFTISVKVKFSNSVEPDYNFDQTFSRYADYDSDQDLSSVEDELTKIILDMIVEDVFNQAFVNW